MSICYSYGVIFGGIYVHTLNLYSSRKPFKSKNVKILSLSTKNWNVRKNITLKTFIDYTLAIIVY